jgi:hypothetical protein
MASTEWYLALEEGPHGGVRIVAAGEEERIVLTRACSERQDLTAEVRALQAELERLLEQGRSRLAEREREKQVREKDPARIWKELEELGDEEEMVASFNALPEESRTRVAEYVLTRVSAFRGMAPRFAGRYNSGTKLLE